MTQPAPDGPYDNSLRSDSPSGIRGLWRQIGVLVDALANFPLLVSLVGDIRNDLRALAGDYNVNPAGWPGLKNWLDERIYPQAEYAETESSLLQRVNTGVGSIIVLRQYVVGGGNPPALGRGENFYTVLQSLDTRLNAANGLLNEQSSVLGFIGDEPAQRSIKSLIAEGTAASVRAADCCEGGGEDPPPDPEPVNQPPVNFGCPGGQRVTSFEAKGTTTVNGETRWLWQARFDTPPAGIAQFVLPAGTGTSYGLAAQATKYDLCIAWNFQGNTVVVDAFGRNRSNSASTAAQDNFANGPTAGGSSFIVGGLTDELSRCDDPDPDNDHCGYIFRTTTNAPPALNVWLSSIERNCAV